MAALFGDRFVVKQNIKNRLHMAPQAIPPRAECSFIELLSIMCSSKLGFSQWTTWFLSGVFDLNRSCSWKSALSLWAICGVFLEEYLAPRSEGDLRVRESLPTVSFLNIYEINHVYLQSRAWGSIVGDLLTVALPYHLRHFESNGLAMRILHTLFRLCMYRVPWAGAVIKKLV